jgi:hypothetical protein
MFNEEITLREMRETSLAAVVEASENQFSKVIFSQSH